VPRPACRPSLSRLLLLTAALGATTTAAAQDPLRGRGIYLNAADVKQQPGMRSCVQCHGLPPDRKLWGAAPAQLQGAFASVTLMGRFATDLSAADVTDLSAFLADPLAAGLPGPQVSAAVANFAAQPGSSGPALGLRLDNAGTASFVLGAVPRRLSGADAATFLVEAGSCTAGARIEPGGGCDLLLRYAPDAAVPAGTVQQAELRIEYADIARATVVALRGLAEPRAAATLSASGVSFAALPAGAVGAPQRVSLTNSGQAVLDLQSLRLAGPAAGDFLLAGSCDARLRLAPGGQCAFDLRFAPTGTGTRVAEVTASFDGGSLSLALSGTGEAAAAAPTAASPPAAPPVAEPAPAPPGGGGGALSPAGLGLLLALLLCWRWSTAWAGHALASLGVSFARRSSRSGGLGRDVAARPAPSRGA
jgi:hypothetical protein